MNRKPCGRCGIPLPHTAKHGALCPDCQHHPANPTYVWERARREVNRYTRRPDAYPDLNYRGPWQLRSGIRRPA